MANPLAQLTTNYNPEPAPGHELPHITFGLEQEFNFAVTKSQFKQYDSLTPPLGAKIRASDASSSHNTGSEKAEFLWNHLRYLQHLLAHTHQHFSNYNTPCPISPIHWDNPKVHPYDKFTLVLDDSVMPKWRAQIKGVWGIDVELALQSRDKWDEAEQILSDKFNEPDFVMDDFFEAIEANYDRIGAELVSKVLRYEDEEYWMSCLRSIQNDLAWDDNAGHGVFMDEEPNLHVHMTMVEDPPLRTVQNIIILYGLFETEIERWHPADLRDSFFCWSMRKGSGMDPYTPHTYAENIYRATKFLELKEMLLDRENIKGSIGIPEGLFLDWCQVNISLPRGVKPTTLEFRQHRGSVDAEEIKWWTHFCARLFHYAHTLTLNNIKIANVAPPTDEDGNVDFLLQFSQKSILEHLKFPEEGTQYFRAKEREYYDEQSERRSILNAIVLHERMSLRSKHPNKDCKELEQELESQAWYKSSHDEYQKALSADAKEQHRLAEIHRKKKENAVREEARLARGVERKKEREAERRKKQEEQR